MRLPCVFGIGRLTLHKCLCKVLCEFMRERLHMPTNLDIDPRLLDEAKSLSGFSAFYVGLGAEVQKDILERREHG